MQQIQASVAQSSEQAPLTSKFVGSNLAMDSESVNALPSMHPPAGLSCLPPPPPKKKEKLPPTVAITLLTKNEETSIHVFSN